MSLNLKEEKSRPALAYSTSQSFISFTPGFNRVAEARRALLPNRFNGFPLPDEIYQSGATRAAQRCSQTSGKVDIMRRMKSRSDVKPAGVKVNVDEQRTDFAYWQTQSYEVRLAALEQIRAEYHGWGCGAEPRLQRVYQIVKR